MTTTHDFVTAVRRHMDREKPDRLARQQLNDLILQWTNETLSSRGDDGEGHVAFGRQGRLTLGGKYMVLTLQSHCRVLTQRLHQNANQDDDDDGRRMTLEFRLEVTHAQFVTAQSSSSSEQDDRQRVGNDEEQGQDNHAEITNDDDDGDEEQDEETQKRMRRRCRQEQHERQSEARVQKAMMERLRHDALVRNVLLLDPSRGEPVCRAILLTRQPCRGGVLEERVDVNDAALETIRKCLWSQAPDNLSVLQWLLDMPLLPRREEGNSLREETHGKEITSHNNNNKTDDADVKELGERTVLRLLEDAMVDACEREGEEEMIEDLSLKNPKDDDDDDEQAEEDTDKSATHLEEEGRQRKRQNTRKSKR